MATDRRGFLRWSLNATALALGGGRATAATASETSLAIHRATRNTRLGAIGDRVRAHRTALLPWKPYPGKQRTRLPAPGWQTGRPLFAASPEATADPATSLSLAELSRLLLLTNGVTFDAHPPRAEKRAAPSAGALYAGEVYVVAEHIADLPPGVYAYGVPGHALVSLDIGSPRLSQVGAALARPADARGAVAAVLLTNVFERYGVRYANRGYRYALIDSGHIGENLRLAATELGLAVASPARFEDARLEALLGVDGIEEAVCAVHLLSPGAAPAPAADGGALRSLRERGPAPGAASLSATERYHAATKLVPGPEPPEAVPHRPERRDPRPFRDAPRMPVHRAIRVRRSAARFLAGPIAREDLERILAFAFHASAALVGRDLSFRVVAHRVTGLAPGTYSLDRAGGTLAAQREGPLADALVDACLGQAKSGEAAVAVVAVARLAEATSSGEARRYRDLLLAAGAAAQRLYLGAEAHGLAARNLAAYYDDELDALLGLDGEREVSVHLTALGPGD